MADDRRIEKGRIVYFDGKEVKKEGKDRIKRRQQALDDPLLQFITGTNRGAVENIAFFQRSHELCLLLVTEIMTSP
jgi:hypothetical protein